MYRQGRLYGFRHRVVTPKLSWPNFEALGHLFDLIWIQETLFTPQPCRSGIAPEALQKRRGRTGDEIITLTRSQIRRQGIVLLSSDQTDPTGKIGFDGLA